MLIEIHALQNHAPSNLNRDDTGSPKECIFGGVRRARISSQCLKRSLRRSDVFQKALEGHLGMRTRQLPEQVRERLIARGASPDVAAVAAKKASGFGTKEGKEQTPDAQGKYQTPQTMFLTEQDIDAVVAVMHAAIETAKSSAKELDKIKAADLQKEAQPKGFRPISVDVALFGRMTTSEALRDVEAACQVAHALSTHKVDHEFDYFTAVDDLRGLSEEEEDGGADMIGDVEFNSACYYKYLSIDTAELVRNLTGEGPFRRKAGEVSASDHAAAVELAASAVEVLIRALALTVPSGKQNTFAAHQRPDLMLVEARAANTPTSYANAFVEPVRPFSKLDAGLVAGSLDKLKGHVELLTAGFNLEASPRLLLAPIHTGFAIDGVERVPDLNTLCGRVAEAVRATESKSDEVGNG